MPRDPTDPCLLCRKRGATKTNSHLIPSFLSTELLSRLSRKYLLMFKPGRRRVSKPSQSTMKENYLMCPECEARIGLLERYMANGFFKLYRNPSRIVEFPKSIALSDRLEMINMPNINSDLFNLFSYSIFWRVANSIEHYPNYNLPEDVNEELRQQLDLHISYEWNSIAIKSKGLSLQDKYPYDITTCLENKKPEKNWLTARDYRSDRPSFIAAHEFHFFFYQSKRVYENTHQFSSDLSAPHIKVIAFTDWQAMIQEIRNGVLGNNDFSLSL